VVQLPLHRYREFIDPTPEELAALAALDGAERTVARGGTVRAEGASVEGIHLLLDGWVSSSVAVADGGRQIVKIHLPGDVLGAPSLALTQAAETLTALTPARVRHVALADFGQLFHAAPRLGATLFLIAQQERVILMDRIASMGRTQTGGRVSALLLHLHERLCSIEPGRDASFDLPLTQEQIGDVIGVTSVHVNRTFRELERAGLVVRDGQRVILPDVAGLRARAGLPLRQWARDVDWIGAPS
jgi:CRP/FNR family transcriptional regulator